MSPTSLRPRRPDRSGPAPSRPGARHAVVALAFLTASVAFMALYPAPRSFVERISIENPTEYDLAVQVSGRGDGWIGISTATRGATTVAEQVLDVGEVWTFRFRSQGEDGGELRRSRDELEQDGWRLRVPARIGEELREQGAPAPG